MDVSKGKKDRPPPPALSGDPDSDYEDKLAHDPDNTEAKIDLGSDESMDASDPPSTSRPGSSQPVPSSGSPDECDGDRDDCD